MTHLRQVERTLTCTPHLPLFGQSIHVQSTKIKNLFSWFDHLFQVKLLSIHLKIGVIWLQHHSHKPTPDLGGPQSEEWAQVPRVITLQGLPDCLSNKAIPRI